MTIKDATVVVVGGSSGIGLGVAQACLAEGAKVVLVGRREEGLAKARAALGDGAKGDRVRTVAADVAREDDVVRMYEAAGAIDHLVVTAASLTYAPIASFDLAAARTCIDSKLVAAILLAKHGVGRMAKTGSLTFTAGLAKDRPRPGGSIVAAVNGALVSLARAFAVEVAPIRVNVVSPGVVDTPVWAGITGDTTPAVFADVARRIPAGRVGTPTDLASAYLFLMQNGFTTGTTLHVDGGHALV